MFPKRVMSSLISFAIVVGRPFLLSYTLAVHPVWSEAVRPGRSVLSSRHGSPKQFPLCSVGRLPLRWHECDTVLPMQGYSPRTGPTPGLFGGTG